MAGIAPLKSGIWFITSAECFLSNSICSGLTRLVIIWNCRALNRIGRWLRTKIELYQTGPNQEKASPPYKRKSQFEWAKNPLTLNINVKKERLTLKSSVQSLVGPSFTLRLPNVLQWKVEQKKGRKLAGCAVLELERHYSWQNVLWNQRNLENFQLIRSQLLSTRQRFSVMSDEVPPYR